MSLSDLARLGTLLTRISGPPLRGWTARRIEERRERVSSRGLRHDIYRHKNESRALIVALHGVTLNGKQDPRLVHLGRCLAASGATCLVPQLPGLSGLRWTTSDIDALTGFIEDLEPKYQPVGLLGFSYAASYSLLAAARPEVAKRIDFVLSFGAYHSLPVLYDHSLANEEWLPDSEREWDDRVYLHLVMANRNAAALDLPEQTVAEVDSLLRRYCHDADPNEKRSFFDRYLKGLDLVRRDHQRQDRKELERLSPAGRLGALKCRVGILHDPEDSLVPSSHARSLGRELAATGCDHRLLITPLLSHVNLSGALNLPEWIRMFSILLPMAEGGKRSWLP